MALTREDVTKLYVASFNRAPDAAGLNYWMNDSAITTLKEMAAAFMQSAEMVALYPTTQTNTQFVESMYSNMFGRTAGPTGLAYWVERLDNGTLPRESMIQALINGANASTGSASDRAILNNKTTVGLAYSNAGLNNVADATTVMANVGTSTLSVTLALSAVSVLQVKAVAAEAAVAAATAAAEAVAAAEAAAVVAAAEAAAAAAAAAAASAAAAADAAAGAVAAALAVELAGYTRALTTEVDNLIGGLGPDTFNGSYGNGAGPYTLQAGDILDGGGGIDTLNITTGAEASTPPDALWVNKIHFEKIVFTSTGNGAQSITTGVNFAAAFADGADLSVTTLLGAIDVTMTGYTPTATITTTTIGAGAHTIITGTGAATVNATAQAAGAQTINGVGLTTVTATINEAGDQVIGTTLGGNIVSVNATIGGAGNQTITSTSSSDVTVVASAAAGSQIITTAGGNDSVTLTTAAGQSTTISTGAGNDTIVGSLGNDTITGGLGADTMTGGGGVDTFIFAKADSNATTLSTITDYRDTGLGADVITLSDVVTAIGTTTTIQDLTAQASLAAALNVAANTNTVNLGLSMFVWAGNTYAFVETAGTATTYAADDFVVKLTGVDGHAIGATIAGLGFDTL